MDEALKPYLKMTVDWKKFFDEVSANEVSAHAFVRGGECGQMGPITSHGDLTARVHQAEKKAAWWQAQEMRMHQLAELENAAACVETEITTEPTDTATSVTPLMSKKDQAFYGNVAVMKELVIMREWAQTDHGDQTVNDVLLLYLNSGRKSHGFKTGDPESTAGAVFTALLQDEHGILTSEQIATVIDTFYALQCNDSAMAKSALERMRSLVWDLKVLVETKTALLQYILLLRRALQQLCKNGEAPDPQLADVMYHEALIGVFFSWIDSIHV